MYAQAVTPDEIMDKLRAEIEKAPENARAISIGSGVSAGQISRFMKNERVLSLANVAKLADYFGLEVAIRRKSRKGIK